MDISVTSKAKKTVTISITKDDLYDMLMTHAQVPFTAKSGDTMVVTHTCEDEFLLDNGRDELIVTITRESEGA